MPHKKTTTKKQALLSSSLTFFFQSQTSSGHVGVLRRIPSLDNPPKKKTLQEIHSKGTNRLRKHTSSLTQDTVVGQVILEQLHEKQRKNPHKKCSNHVLLRRAREQLVRPSNSRIMKKLSLYYPLAGWLGLVTTITPGKPLPDQYTLCFLSLSEHDVPACVEEYRGGRTPPAPANIWEQAKETVYLKKKHERERRNQNTLNLAWSNTD